MAHWTGPDVGDNATSTVNVYLSAQFCSYPSGSSAVKCYCALR